MTPRGNGQRNLQAIPLQIALLYGAFGALWIILSDRLLAMLIADPATISLIQTYKGWFYVLVTAVILYLLVQRYTRALRTQFDEIRTIFDSMNAVVYVADLQTHEMLFLNHQGEKHFRVQQWAGKSCYQVLQSGQDGPCDFCTNDRLVRNGELQPPVVWEFQNTINQHWYQCIDKAIRWTDGRLARLEIALDITETKEMEQLKDEILSSVSHEMRTPLTAVLGFAEYLLDNELPADERRTHMQTLVNEALRLNRLIDNFLRLTRLKARRESYQMIAISPRELLRAAIEKPVNSHRLRLECAENLPTIFGDFLELSLAIDSLVANAIKYSPAGSEVTLAAQVVDGEVVFSVADQGIGMNPADLERIFTDFYRVDNSDRRRTSGAGLGLSLSREIVRLHRGRIWAESTPQQGSRFFIALPTAQKSGNSN